MRIHQLTAIKALEPVHSLHRFGKRAIVGEFIPTREAAAILTQAVASLVITKPADLQVDLPSPEQTLRSFLVRANFGTGKTILLLALGEMLYALGDPDLFAEWHALFHGYPDLQRLYAQLRAETRGRPFVVLVADLKEKGGTPLRDVVVRALLDWVKRYDSEIRTNSEFDLAVQHLTAARERMPELLAAAVATHAPGLEVEELISLLHSWDRSALEISYTAMAEAAGFAPDRNRVEMRSYYEEIRRQLVGKVGGIVLLCDEMHHFFTTSASFPGQLAGSLADLDAFAVYVNETKHDQMVPCLLVGAVHENLSSYLRGAGTSGDAFEQAKGRFREYPLTSSLSQTELICGAFRPNHDAFEELVSDPDTWVQAQVLAALAPSGTQWQCFFPLHPSVVTNLPTLARRLAQNDRTTFHFLDVAVRNHVEQDFAISDGRLNLVALPSVYDYFLSAIEERDSSVLKAVQMAVQYCSGGRLHEQVMKTFACLHIAGSVSSEDGGAVVRQAVTVDQMARLINHAAQAEVKQVLEELLGSGYLHRNDRMEYILIVGGGLSAHELEQRVKGKMREVDPDAWLVKRLQDPGLRRQTAMGSGRIKERITRDFRIQILPVTEVASFQQPTPTQYSGHLLFVIPSCGMTPEQFRSVVEPHLSRLHGLGAIVALPRRWDFLDGDVIRRQEALRAILQTARSTEEKQRITETLERLEEDLRWKLVDFGQPSNWILETQFGPMQSSNRFLTDFLTQMVERLYPRFPEFRSNGLDTATVVHNLLERFLLNPVALRCDATTRSRAEQVLVAVGLATQAAGDPAVFSLAAPHDEVAHPNALEIWALLDEIDWSGETPLATLYDRLELPPYGMPRHLTDLFLGIWLRMRGAIVRNRKGGVDQPEINLRLIKDLAFRRDEGFTIEIPRHLDPELLVSLGQLWALIGQTVGTTNYLVATDQAVAPRQKRELLLNDLYAFGQRVSAELLSPARTLGRPDEDGEALVAELDRLRVEESASPEALFRALVCEIDPGRLQALRERLGSGAGLAAMAALVEAVNTLPTFDVEHFPDLAKQRAELVDAVGKLSPTDQEFMRRLRTGMDQFRTNYLTRYAEAHDRLNEARSKFGQELLAAPGFELLRRLSQLVLPPQVPAPVRSADLESRVVAVLGQVCPERGATRLAAGHGWTCNNCRANAEVFWMVEEELAHLKETEARLAADFALALQEWSALLDQFLDDEFPKTLGLPPLFDSDSQAFTNLKRALRSLGRFLDENGGEAEAREQLETVLPQLNGYLSIARGGGQPRNRKSVHDLADLIEETLGSQGLEMIQLDAADPSKQRPLLTAFDRVVQELAKGGVEILIRRRRRD